MKLILIDGAGRTREFNYVDVLDRLLALESKTSLTENDVNDLRVRTITVERDLDRQLDKAAVEEMIEGLVNEDRVNELIDEAIEDIEVEVDIRPGK